jgi:hypothetical protein
MNRTTFFSRLIAASFILLSSFAHSTATLTFRDPDGTANSTDTIPVWLTLTTDTDMNFDGSDPDGDSTYGGLVNPADIPTSGFSFGQSGTFVFAGITSVQLNNSFTCTGSFTSGHCSPGDEYKFSFNLADPSLALLDTFNLNAGESRDFLFGEFTPVDGAVDPGFYNFFSANLFIGFDGFGFDMDGNEVDVHASLNLASTCPSGDTSCDFSRTVVGTAVPLPATIWLFLSALGLLGFRGHRTS